MTLDPAVAVVQFVQARHSGASLEVQAESLRRAIADPSLTLAEIHEALDDVLTKLADLVKVAHGVNPDELPWEGFLDTVREVAEDLAP